MDKPVDSLCFEVSAELERIADIRYTLKRGRKHMGAVQVASLKGCEDDFAERVEHAHQPLAELHLNLGANVLQSSSSGLDGTIAKLTEETLIAQRVRRRIEADYGAEIVPSDEAMSSTERPRLME